MRSGILLWLLTIWIHARSESNQQPVLITLNLKNAPIELAFKEINQKTDFKLIYDNDVINNAKPVTVSVKNKMLEEVLPALFIDQPFNYTITGKSIIIVPVKKRPAENSEKDTLITGRVLSDSIIPLEGASVILKGTARSVSTGKDGYFTLLVPGNNSRLLVSYVGFESTEIPVSNFRGRPVEIKLKRKEARMDEVTIVSTGFQDIPKERATGSFYKVNTELFNRRVSTNIIDRLFDVTSGLTYSQVTSNGGDAPDGILVRGLSTINASKLPLVVVDNFPYDGDLKSLNPNDISSVTILKDAAAASIWGVRAGNGVIVITTKKGRFNERSNISFNSNVTIGEKPDLSYIPVITSREMVDFEKTQFSKGLYNDYDDVYPAFNYFAALPIAIEVMLAQRRGDITDAEASAQLEKLSAHDVRNDISKYMLHPSVNQQYALSFSGGSSIYNYFGSIGYDANVPVQKEDKYTRITIRFNNNWRPLKKLEINSEIYYVQSKNKSSGQNFIGLLPIGVNTSPYTMLADENGKSLAIPYAGGGYRLAYTDTAIYPALLDWNYRPIDELNNTITNVNQFDTRLAAGVKYHLLSFINAEIRYQYQKVIEDNTTIANPAAYLTRSMINKYVNVDPGTGAIIYPIPPGAAFSNNTRHLSSWNLRSQLNFNYTWKQNQVSAIAGIETREVSSIGVSNPIQYGYDESSNTFSRVMYGTWRTNPDGGNVILNAPTVIKIGSLNRYAGYFANGSYVLEDKYILSASARIDQSNFFGVRANQTKVPLWSAGIGWNINNEQFYHISWLPFLKLRATLGYNGNTNNSASAFSIIRAYSSSGSIPYAPFAQIISPPNSNLRWEKVQVVNFGIDFGIKNNRLSGGIEYYIKKGIDLISSIIIDATTGFSSYAGNNASLKSKGIDVVLNSININKRLAWTTNFLLSYNAEKLYKYEVPELKTGADYTTNPKLIGKPLYNIYSYNWAGLDPVNGDARIYAAGHPVNSGAYLTVMYEDMVYSGRTIPSVFGSIRNSFSFKKVMLSANISFKAGYCFRRSTIEYGMLLNSWSAHADYSLRWQKPGDENITSVPSVPEYADSRSSVYSKSNILVEKGDHIRLQDIRLSYDLTINKLNGQVYLYANNIGIIWRANKHGIDPDAANFGNIPAPKTIAAGLSLNL